MGKLKNLKFIEILSSTPYYPLDKISCSLIANDRLQLELEKIKQAVKQFPLSSYSYNHSYLLEVAALFGVKLTFKKYLNNEIGALCWPEYKRIQIFIHKDYSYSKHALTHEIGHILQVKLDLFKETKIIYLSSQLEMEQQAESISYYLCKILWSKEKFNQSDFNCYFEEDDIIWLDSFYKDLKNINYINDVFVLKSKRCLEKK